MEDVEEVSAAKVAADWVKLDSLKGAESAVVKGAAAAFKGLDLDKGKADKPSTKDAIKKMSFKKDDKGKTPRKTFRPVKPLEEKKKTESPAASSGSGSGAVQEPAGDVTETGAVPEVQMVDATKEVEVVPQTASTSSST
ncbi:hypothetical protein NMY22_g13997 [Coprinellus aureogranulatus]|nr:hypothetical protein NMY22_g13997 [Coprinellus aureogranulatus]